MPSGGGDRLATSVDCLNWRDASIITTFLTLDSFHFIGTLPSLTDWLNREVTEGAILAEVALSILADISSGPLDFEIFKEASIS